LQNIKNPLGKNFVVLTTLFLPTGVRKNLIYFKNRQSILIHWFEPEDHGSLITNFLENSQLVQRVQE